jgi:hypothetical protein
VTELELTAPALDALVVRSFRNIVADSPSPTSDLNVVYRIEEELRRRGLEMQYQDALWKVVPVEDTAVPGAGVIEGLWPLFHATGEQRCRAALLALTMPRGYTVLS